MISLEMQNATPSSFGCFFFFDPLWFTVVNSGMTPAVSLTREDKAREVSP